MENQNRPVQEPENKIPMRADLQNQEEIENQKNFSAQNDDPEDSEDDGEEEDLNTDWGNVDPQENGGSSDMDPSGPGSAV